MDADKGGEFNPVEGPEGPPRPKPKPPNTKSKTRPRGLTKRLHKSKRLSKRGSGESEGLASTSGSDSNKGVGTSTSRRLRRSSGSDTQAQSVRATAGSGSDSSTGEDPMVGSTVEGKYRIIEPIGSGGMAVVYKAWHLMLEKNVALKLIHPRAAERESFKERFYREARIASELVHEHIVQTREFGETVDGRFYMLMDFCPGETLTAMMKLGPMPPARGAGIMAQALSALAAAHTRAIVHRDMKPENIMVDENDFARILDFGLAKMLADGGDSSDGRSLTRDGAVLGTPKYMSPEQALGQKCDHRADLYSAGMVLYEAVCGRLPFDAFTPAEMVRKHIVETPKRPSEIVPELEIPGDLEAAIMKALAKKPEDRWESADAFKQALEQFLRGGQVDVSVPTTPDTFELRGMLEVSGLDPSVTPHRVRHKARDLEGVSWVIAPGRLSGLTVAGFLAQIDVVRRVVHPALAPNLEAGAYVGEQLYAFTRWHEGPTLAERLAQGPMPEAQVLALARPILEAMAKAHEFGVNHLVIQPSLVTEPSPGRPVLHGLGIEPAARGDPGDPQQDVEALGLLFLQLLAGKPGELKDVRDAGLAAASGPLRQMLDEATGDSPYPNAQLMLRTLPSTEHGRKSSGGVGRLLVAVVLLLLLAGGAAFGVMQMQGGTGGALQVATTPEATVEVRGLGDQSDVVRRDQTDSGGRLTLGDLPPGRYQLTVTLAGFATRTANANISADRTAKVVLELEKEEKPIDRPADDGSGDPRIGALMLRSLELQKPLCKHEVAELKTALEDATIAGYDWTGDEDLVTRSDAVPRKLEELLQASAALTPSSKPETIEAISDELTALTQEIESLKKKLQQGLEALAELKKKLKKRRRLAERWKKKVDRRSALKVARPFIKNARAAMTKASEAEAKGDHERARRWYGKAIKEFSLANDASKEVRNIQATLKRLSEAVALRNGRRVGKEFVDPGDVMELFDGIFRRGVSLKFEVGFPTIEGDRAWAPVTAFSFIDRRADSRVVMQGYQVNLKRIEGIWKVVNVRRRR